MTRPSALTGNGKTGLKPTQTSTTRPGAKAPGKVADFLNRLIESLPPRPTLLRNLGFWLLAMGLGTVSLLFVVALTSPGRDSNTSAPAYFTALIAAVAGVLSLTALPLLLPLLPWALGAGPVGLRWLRVFTLQSLSLGLLTGLACCFGGLERAALPVAATYFVAGLLAAPLAYARWLLPRSRPGGLPCQPPGI